MNWQEIALEYKWELEQTHKDMSFVLEELEKRMPRTYEKAVHRLSNSISDSVENYRHIKLMEPIPATNVFKNSFKDDCFEGLL